MEFLLTDFFIFYYFLYLYFNFDIYRTDVGVKSIYHETQPNNIFKSLVNEFISKKHPKRR